MSRSVESCGASLRWADEGVCPYVIHQQIAVHRLVYCESFKYVGNAIARDRFDGNKVTCLKSDANASEKQVFRCGQDDNA